MILDSLPNVRELTIADKLQLLSELWTDVQSHPEELLVDEALLDELDTRARHHAAHPETASTWEEAKARVLSRRSSQ